MTQTGGPANSGEGIVNASEGLTHCSRRIEIEALQKALTKEEETIKQAQAARERIAAQLKELGQTVIVKPWTTDHLRNDWVHRCGDFRELYGECEDLEIELDDCAKTWAIELLKMHDAIAGQFATDGIGYIDEDGEWRDFEATEEELAEFSWSDADVPWKGYASKSRPSCVCTCFLKHHARCVVCLSAWEAWDCATRVTLTRPTRLTQ